MKQAAGSGRASFGELSVQTFPRLEVGQSEEVLSMRIDVSQVNLLANCGRIAKAKALVAIGSRGREIMAAKLFPLL